MDSVFDPIVEKIVNLVDSEMSLVNQETRIPATVSNFQTGYPHNLLILGIPASCLGWRVWP